MSKTQDALKLALEALSPWAGEDANHTEQYAAYHAISEALAEQETVLPGGDHVPTVPVAVYGYCPECGGAGVMRERRPNGDDKCTNGHKYPSSKALAEQPAQQEPVCYKHGDEPKQGCAWCDKQPAQPQHEPVAWMELLREARDNCKASIVEEGISAIRKEYRIDLEARLTAALNAAPQPAQQEQKPVAKDWSVFNTGAEVWSGLSLEDAVAELTPERMERGWSAVCVINSDNPPLYTSPPAQRKPLTDEEIESINVRLAGNRDLARLFARAIEAKLKEKNT